MTATSILLILVGIFIIVNAPNFVGVIKGDKQFAFQGATNTSPSSSASTDTTGRNTLTGTSDPRAGK